MLHSYRLGHRIQVRGEDRMKILRTRSLFARLVSSYLLVIVVTLLILSLSLSYLFDTFYLKTKQSEYMGYARSIAGLVTDPVYYVRPGALEEALAVATRFVNGTVWIVDRDGLVLASSGREDPKSVRLNTSEVSEVLNGNEVAKIGKVAGFFQPMLVVTVPIVFQKQVIGAVLIYTPLADIRSTIHAVRTLMVYAGVVAVILSAVVSYYFSHSLAKPLHNMNLAASEMARGRFDQRVPVGGHDEIKELAETLNLLACELEKSEQKQRQFIADVSHELKTPLTSIQGFVEGILDKVITSEEDVTRYLTIVVDEVNRLARLVNDLLEMSRLDSGEYRLLLEPVSLPRLITTTVDKVLPQIRQQGIDINVDAPKKGFVVMGDRDRIQQILLNLLYNAIKHTPQGGEISVNLTRVDEFARTSIHNTGDGIPETELPLIWDRFYKVDKSRARSKGGIGLGLSIVKQLVELQSGKVEAISERGKGATFSFYLPLV